MYFIRSLGCFCFYIAKYYLLVTIKTMQEFQIKLDRFEGPYTKLLEMIESRKLSITEIALASLADGYISYIKDLEQEDGGKLLVDISQFILVATTLILMKAKSLLPTIVYTEEEEKQVHNLEHKLELYASLIEACSSIKNIFSKTILYGRSRVKYKSLSVFVPGKNVDVGNLHSIATLTIASFKPPENLAKAQLDKKMRIENVIDNLILRVRKEGNTSFFKLIEGFGHSYEEKKKLIIVNFLALLELVRMGNLEVEQLDNAGEIIISNRQTSVQS